MLHVESENVYEIQKRHPSDSAALCIRRALKACRQGDGVYCGSISHVSAVKREAYRRGFSVMVRKQNCGGWILYPVFYRKPKPLNRPKKTKTR